MNSSNILNESGNRMKKGQSIIEYALLIAVVATAIGAMSVYVRRAVQANFKVIEQRVNAP